MAHDFATTRRVEFAETDLAGIAHFSNFFRWMESAEHEFLRSLGLTVHGELGGKAFGFARVHASCDYSRPVRYQDLLEIRLRVSKKTAKALAYDFDFHVLDEPAEKAGARAARGRLEVVCVSGAEPGGTMRAIDVPPEIARALETAP